MKFHKGDILSVKYVKRSFFNPRTFSGHYEVIRCGARYYLFCNDNGQDWNPTKKELIQAMEDYKK